MKSFGGMKKLLMETLILVMQMGQFLLLFMMKEEILTAILGDHLNHWVEVTP